MKAKLAVAVRIVVTELCNTFIQFLRNLMIFCQEVMKLRPDLIVDGVIRRQALYCHCTSSHLIPP